MIIKHKIGKEGTFYILGNNIKDLNYLNRKMNNVIYIDYDIKNTKNTPFNVIILPEFNGDENDKELLQIIPFLKDLSAPNVKDVRTEIEKYGNFKPHLKYYKANPKYHKLLPKSVLEIDDDKLKSIVKGK